MTRGSLVVAIAVVNVGICGCGANKRSDPLPDAVRTYNEGIRWERFHEASLRIPVSRRDDFLDERDQLREDVSINHYEVIRVRFSPNGLQAKVQVKYTWYRERRGVIRETHAVQTWQRRDGFWFITDEKRLRGALMPGVSEPEDGAEETGEEAPDELSKHPSNDETERHQPLDR